MENHSEIVSQEVMSSAIAYNGWGKAYTVLIKTLEAHIRNTELKAEMVNNFISFIEIDQEYSVAHISMMFYN